MRAICIFLLGLFALQAQFPPPEIAADRNPLRGDPEAVVAGKKLFADSCSGCHGANGEGGRGPNLAEGRRLRRLFDKALFTSIQSGVRGTDMPPTNLPDTQIWQLVAFVRSLAAPASESRLPGDPDAGAAIFSGKGGCEGCHMLHGRGGFIGPDLTDIGAQHPAPRLLESIVKPSARIVEGYEGVRVTTLDGKEISGVARNNDDYSIQILDAKGELHLLSKEKLRSLTFRGTSLMPDDYAKRLSAEEITNLVAYLSRQTVRPPGERAPGAMRGGRR